MTLLELLKTASISPACTHLQPEGHKMAKRSFTDEFKTAEADRLTSLCSVRGSRGLIDASLDSKESEVKRDA